MRALLATSTPPSFVGGGWRFGVGHLSERSRRSALARLKLPVGMTEANALLRYGLAPHPTLGPCLDDVGDLAVTGTGHFA